MLIKSVGELRPRGELVIRELVDLRHGVTMLLLVTSLKRRDVIQFLLLA